MIDRKSRVCVVIPVYNRPALLRKAVESVVNQTYQEFRLVVVDDASSENLTNVRDYVTGLGHEWMHLDENSGPAKARNTGATACDSEWICFLDSDDLWLPEKLERQIAWHLKHPEIRISQVKEKWIRNSREIKRPKHWEQKEGELFAESIQRCSIGPSCVMIRRDLWNESGGFNEFYRACEDYELWLRICRHEPVGLVPGDFLAAKYAGHDDQLSETIPALDRYRVLALLELLLEGGLSEAQRELVLSGITRKSEILATGALKRRKDREEIFYRTVAGQVVWADQSKLTDWVRILRKGLIGEIL